MADIAPTEYPGFTISPVENSQIEMKSATVDIYCFSPYKVIAKFQMWNHSPDSINLFVGFPVDYLKREKEEYAARRARNIWVPNEKNYDFKVWFNGKVIDNIVSTTQRDIFRKPSREIKWFGWNYTFEAGETNIEVIYDIEPSRSYQAFWQNLYYILHTGSLWKGNISYEKITIHFEDYVAKEQIRGHTSPSNYTVDGTRISWEMIDFEPTRDDDIRLEFMPSNVYKKLQILRNNLERDPNNEHHIVELAKHYFPLGQYIKHILPYKLPVETYDSVLEKISDPDDKHFFTIMYSIREKKFPKKGITPEKIAFNENLQKKTTVHILPPGWRNIIDEQNNRAYERIMRILSEADYLPIDLSEYVIDAKKMLENLLEKNPKNTEAWFVYLSNYSRFKFCSCEPMSLFSSPTLREQKEIIEKAYHNCPEHEGIKLWHNIASLDLNIEFEIDRNTSHMQNGPWKNFNNAAVKTKMELLKYYESSSYFQINW